MSLRQVTTLVVQFLLITTVSAASLQAEKRSACRYIPGDHGWPAKTTWDNLNTTVQGRLIATDPLAHVCHDPTYSNATCTYLKENWGVPGVQ